MSRLTTFRREEGLLAAFGMHHVPHVVPPVLARRTGGGSKIAADGPPRARNGATGEARMRLGGSPVRHFEQLCGNSVTIILIGRFTVCGLRSAAPVCCFLKRKPGGNRLWFDAKKLSGAVVGQSFFPGAACALGGDRTGVDDLPLEITIEICPRNMTDGRNNS